ncbi:LOW QUALITY PROTEIN: maternal effect protein oskar [Drosophila tropicalis]|uniref:LOW QUALITY PROTEIN: maternal effect protein oskar n=1 Tax=Drosophila tropicalis TaxID=46794 RepID=UPI0035ABA766
MATFRSESNSVPITKNSSQNQQHRLLALKERLTTCFHQLRQNFQQKSPTLCNGQFYRIFIKADYTILGEKATYIKKLRKYWSSRKENLETKSKFQPEIVVVDHHHQLQLETVTRLFSSTLINETSKMTILESLHLSVRDENPDIDSEIRGILLAHAQNGITISNIKREYRSLTGNHFPVHENITDFLLTIPNVTAECRETGTRIFNIKPKKRNSHLHEMVVNQRQRNDYFNIESKQEQQKFPQPPRSWRSQYKRCALNALEKNLHEYEKMPNIMMAKTMQQQTVETAVTTPQQLAKAVGEDNWCYQDNWNHLNNHYQQQQPYCEPPVAELQQQQPTCPPSTQQFHNFLIPPPPPSTISGPTIQSDVSSRKRRRGDYSRTPTTTTISSNSQTDSIFTINSDYDAYLLDFPLLGDDFLLYLARMELKCRFKKYTKVLQSGLCISGQTINAARQNVCHVELPEQTQIIVNIGSVDIMRGRPLVQIEHDFRQLIKEMHNRRFIPVITTLAPLANYRHDQPTCDKINRFNKFIRKECRHLKVIDIHSCLINDKGIVLFDCYQNGPRAVTGSKEPYVFWNKIGRQRVLQMIEANLEY